MVTQKKPSSPGLELDVKRLCEAIENERQRRGLTYQKVAAELGVNYGTMCYWRRGDTAMNGHIALRVAVWLNCDLRKFARQPDPPVTTKAA